MSIFYIKQPNNTRFELYYDTDITTEEKIQRLEETILNQWNDYIIDKWIWLNKWEQYKYNHEDNVKYLLSRCSDFLLQGELNHEGMWMGTKKQRKIYAVESVLTSSSNNVNDFIYSIGNDSTTEYIHKDDISFRDEKKEKILNKHLKFEFNNKKVRKYKKDNKDRQKRIRSLSITVDYSKPYKSKWCIVGSDNFFEFDNKIFGIEGFIEEYQGKVMRNGDLFYEQDKILAYVQNGKYYFYNMGYYKISEAGIWLQQDNNI